MINCWFERIFSVHFFSHFAQPILIGFLMRQKTFQKLLSVQRAKDVLVDFVKGIFAGLQRRVFFEVFLHFQRTSGFGYVLFSCNLKILHFQHQFAFIESLMFDLQRSDQVIHVFFLKHDSLYGKVSLIRPQVLLVYILH